MILRRLTRHVKDQNWFAVGLDFVIVVIGVFIGLQVSNWNATRADKATGAAYLARIAADIRSDDARLADIMETWREDAAQTETIVHYLEGDPVGDLTDWDMFQIIYYGAGWTPFSPNRVTYDELISTGKFSLVADPALRREIGDYYAALDDFAGFYSFQTPMRETVRSKYSPGVQTYMWEACFPEAHYRGADSGWRDCAPPEDAEKVAATLDALKRSDEVLDAARYAASVRVILLRAAPIDRTRAQDLAAKIEGYFE